MTDASAGASANAFVERGAAAETTMKERGYLTYEVVGPDGKVKQTATSENALTTVGAVYILDLVRPTAHSSPGVHDTSLYLGLIGDVTGVLSSADTMVTQAGWSEEDDTSYIRKTWDPAAATSGAPSFLTYQSTFTENGSTIIVYGAFLTTDLGDVSGTTGTLIATSLLTGGGTLSIGADDTLNITFKLTLA